MKRVSKFIVIMATLALLGGCAALSGVEHTGAFSGYDCYTVRSADKMGINTASTFLVDQKDGKLAYGNTAGQPGVGKAVVEQILPSISNAAIGTFTGAFSPKSGSTNINTGSVTQGQGQGQFSNQQQGQTSTVR